MFNKKVFRPTLFQISKYSNYRQKFHTGKDYVISRCQVDCRELNTIEIMKRTMPVLEYTTRKSKKVSTCKCTKTFKDDNDNKNEDSCVVSKYRKYSDFENC